MRTSSPVATLARSLFTFSGLLAASGAGLAAITSGAGGFTSALAVRWSDAFQSTPWSFAPIAAAATAGTALVLTGIDAFVHRRRVPKPKAGPHDSVSEALEVIRAELEASVGAPFLERNDPDAVAACDTLLRGALRLGASDLHVSPTPDGVHVTYRVDSELCQVMRLRPSVLAPMVARFKILAKMDTYVKSTPQDGRLSAPVEGVGGPNEPAKLVEARVSTLPTESGERVVLRFLGGGRSVPDLAALGFSSALESGLADVLSRPQGLFFVTGPVGSGKTTTLYSALQHIAQTRGKTTTQVTLEDPIELELPFATQSQIHNKAGMTFASALRSVLRQDPNVLMVGEIRDKETAEIAMQAGLTGHLILTTVHGQSAAGVFARLIDMGIEPFLLGSATIASLSQRLVRSLCTLCRKPEMVEVSARARFEAAGLSVPPTTYFAPVGCPACGGQGFSGRIPIGELLRFDEPVRVSVRDRAPTNEIERVAIEGGMKTLLADGLARAALGETSLAEVLRVAG